MKIVRGAVVALLLVLALPGRADAVESGIWTGVCPIMNISISQPGRAVPKAGAVSMSATGNCVGTTSTNLVASGGGTVTLPVANSLSFGCLSGTAASGGTASFPGVSNVTSSITVVNTGGVITVSVVSGIKLVAVGEFVATSVAACNSTGALTGVGSMYYFDPTLPPPLS